MERFIKIFGLNFIGELLADREFVCTEWFAWLKVKGYGLRFELSKIF